MNELINHARQLPDTIEDLSKFVLVGREKLNSVRAEIRAIDKVHLAEEVRNQKRDEARMLSEALLDAEVRLGDLLKQIPRVNSNQYIKKMQTDIAVHVQKPKSEIIKGLGFSEKQAQRFEILSDNKDLVEHVKQEARENDDLPTRTRVIDLAQQRKKREAEEQEKDINYNAHIDECFAIWKKFNNALVTSFIAIETDTLTLKKWKEAMELGKAHEEVEHYLDCVAEDLSKLLTIQKFLKEVKKQWEKL